MNLFVPPYSSPIEGGEQSGTGNRSFWSKTLGMLLWARRDNYSRNGHTIGLKIGWKYTGVLLIIIRHPARNWWVSPIWSPIRFVEKAISIKNSRRSHPTAKRCLSWLSSERRRPFSKLCFSQVWSPIQAGKQAVRS